MTSTCWGAPSPTASKRLPRRGGSGSGSRSCGGTIGSVRHGNTDRVQSSASSMCWMWYFRIDPRATSAVASPSSAVAASSAATTAAWAAAAVANTAHRMRNASTPTETLPTPYTWTGMAAERRNARGSRLYLERGLDRRVGQPWDQLGLRRHYLDVPPLLLDLAYHRAPQCKAIANGYSTRREETTRRLTSAPTGMSVGGGIAAAASTSTQSRIR